ncbi:MULTISPECIES: tyrosine-type recombinase/integrase [Spongiibacteraceae]|jgi:site-specific recombinase XerD|uniref:tyrosine-type recombinase/integrase n=1 Tax=Spongiibacteraceae TaxID=1706375 RepID=UPI0022B3A532|nr:site-specific integrase [Marortus sp. BJYM1]
MSTVLHDSGVGLKRSLQREARVGTRRASACIETYLRRAYELFGGGKNGKDVVLLLELFFFYKCGSDGNKLGSAKQAISAISDFLGHTKAPPWKWTPPMLYEYLTDLKARDLAGQTIRARHHYIKNMCDAILADRDIANKVLNRHPESNFQQITDVKSRALVRGFCKKKKKLVNPTPADMQRVYDYLQSEIEETIETGGATPWVLFRDRTIIAMFDAYGARLSELRNADTTDFDFDPECPEYGDLGIWHIIGKGDKDRHLPILTEWIHPVLDQYLANVRPHWLGNPNTPEEDLNALFFSNEGRRLSTTRIQGIIQQRFQQAGINKRFSPHRLRNGCLTRLTDKVGLSTASRVGGHSHASTTEGYYDRKASLAGDALSNYVKNVYKNHPKDSE